MAVTLNQLSSGFLSTGTYTLIQGGPGSTLTGYQLASRFRSHLSTCVRKVPLLAIAEYSLYGTTELARAAGFMGWLPKPVEPVALNALLARLQSGAWS